MDTQFRISPTMASSRIAALAFIRQFIALTGKGPSLGEIAAAIGCSRETAKRARNRLARDGDIVMIGLPGTHRGIALPDTSAGPGGAISTIDAIEVLRAAGYVIDEDIQLLALP